MDWIRENYGPLSLLVNIAVLLIWTVYAGLLYREYSRQHQAHLVIQATDRRMEQAECLLINLSPDAVHIRALLIAAVDGEYSYHVTEPHDGVSPSLRTESMLREGPLRLGDFMAIGRVSNLAAPIVEEPSLWLNESVARFELRVVFEQRSGQLYGARHGFEVRRNDGDWSVTSESLFTEHLTSRSDRKRVGDWLEAVANPLMPRRIEAEA